VTTDAAMRLRADVAVAETDYGMILLDERSGRYWQLNQAAAAVVSTLAAGDRPEQAVSQITAEFDVDEADARRDVDALLADLVTAGLVVVNRQVQP
jgi:hypothetical protein